MIPQMETTLTEIPEIISYPNKTYKCTETQIIGKVTDLEAIKQAIFHILSIERYAYIIYDDSYGVELQKYIGQDLSYIEATIEETLKEALTQDDRIVNVRVTNISTSKEFQTNTDKSLLYDILQTEDNKDIVIETTHDILITEKKDAYTTANSKVTVVNVEFDVYCKQGVIHTEVNVNV